MQVLNLSVHAGGSKIERAELQAVETPHPTPSWSPIPHARLLDGVQGALERSGLRVIAEAHAVSHDGARYFGLLQVTTNGDAWRNGMLQLANGHQDQDYGLVVGLRNSHDKTFPAGLVVGSGVFVCDNLAFSGEVEIARKHTTNIGRDLPSLIERAVGRVGDVRRHQSVRIDAYKANELTDGRAHDLIIQALDARVVPVTKVPDVLKEWRAPRHPEFAANGKTAWRLFNSFTEVLKESALFRRPAATQALHGLLDTACAVK